MSLMSRLRDLLSNTFLHYSEHRHDISMAIPIKACLVFPFLRLLWLWNFCRRHEFVIYLHWNVSFMNRSKLLYRRREQDLVVLPAPAADLVLNGIWGWWHRDILQGLVVGVYGFPNANEWRFTTVCCCLSVCLDVVVNICCWRAVLCRLIKLDLGISLSLYMHMVPLLWDGHTAQSVRLVRLWSTLWTRLVRCKWWIWS